MRHHMTLLHDPDHQALTTDPTLTITTPEGKQVTVLPFRLGPTHPQPRWEVQATIQRTTPVQTPTPSMPPGTPISTQSQLKEMQPPTMPSVRVPSTGSMHPLHLLLCPLSRPMSLPPSSRPRLTLPAPHHLKETWFLKMPHLNHNQGLRHNLTRSPTCLLLP